MKCLYLASMLILAAVSAPETIDFADPAMVDAWTRHPVYGDPSFDSFEHRPENPVYRGNEAYAWPVNGFLFEDPESGYWYLYVGHYQRNYALEEGRPSYCTVFRSEDAGASWEHLGPIFGGEAQLYLGEVSPIGHAPDVSVTYVEGRYHLCFDWTTRNTTWANAANPDADSNNGVGYAWSDRPEGPFQITARPLATTRDQAPLLGKYRRLYASTLIRRTNDWLVLTLTDSGGYFGWGLLGMTSAEASGPYSSPELLLHPERAAYHPPLLEFFPAFTHEGYIYAPTTSVALNRNFQTIFRVPIEEAMNPDAWEIYQNGSVWHAEAIENEAYGIWGQTFSAFVDKNNVLQAMFPSRDRDGLGTINLASRPWNQPLGTEGFVLSGHEGPSVSYLKRGGPAQRLAFRMEVQGEVTILWNAQGPLGPNRASSGASLHPLAVGSYSGLALSEDRWAFVETAPDGAETTRASGEIALQKDSLDGEILQDAEGTATLILAGENVWSGALEKLNGRFGLLAKKHSWTRVKRFAIEGTFETATLRYLYPEALLGAAQQAADWEAIENDSRFLYGIGAISKTDTARTKWNFEGRSIRLFAPRGPGFGTAAALLDGDDMGVIDFGADTPQDSAALFVREGLCPGRHTLILSTVSGRFPLDTLEVVCD